MDKQELVEIVKEVIDYQLMDGWAYILLFVGSLCAAFIGSRLKASAEISAINQNFTELLGQQKKLAKEVGAIKAAIDKDNIRYQIKLSDFNAKSIESYEQIYSSLLKLKGECKALDCNQTGQQRQRIVNAVDEFADIYQLKRIWIPTDISNKLEVIAEEIKHKSEEFYAVSIKIEKLHQTQDNPDLDGLHSQQDQFYQYLDIELPLIFSDIAKEISSNISAEDT